MLTNDLPAPDWEQVIETCESSAWRFEQQPWYKSDLDTGWPARWFAGDRTPPTFMTEFAKKFLVGYFASGRTRRRLRLVDTPMTAYQQWADWAADIHRAVGETIATAERQWATNLGITGEPLEDWWLIDDKTVLIMRFDPDRRLIAVDHDTRATTLSRCRRVRDIATQELAELR